MADFDRVYQIFSQACERPLDERDSFIREACGSDLQLREKVDALLRLDQQTQLPLDHMDDGGAARALVADAATPTPVEIPPPAATPNRIGRYAILEELGRGGMGIVYEAEQDNPRRRVALKLVRQGIDTEPLRARFRQEAHVLGHLRHPGIAQVFEAGAETVGHSDYPYLAMELIDGAALDRYAADLPIAARIELIARVCDAVQHAHQKGVIHRDLKPANILVARDATVARDDSGAYTDGIGQPKVMDFGIARLTDSDLQLTNVETDAGQIIGTLAYMSPEQLRGDSAALDTRCDVYALGTILYELLSGRKPHDLSGRPLAEAARVITDQEPARIGTLHRRLRGDIDTIITKAMHKDPDQRYASAGELANDLRRYLRNEPILARPGSVAYQVRKFAHRHRTLVGIVTTATVAVVALLIGLVYQSFEVARQRDQALTAAGRVERMFDFQTAMIQEADLTELGGQLMNFVRDALVNNIGDEALREQRLQEWQDLQQALNPTDLARQMLSTGVLDPALEDNIPALRDDPLLAADLLMSVGDTYARLGLFEPAADSYQQALDLRTETMGARDPQTLYAQMKVLNARGRDVGLEASVEPLEAVVQAQREVLGESHVQLAESLNSLGRVYSLMMREGEAEAAHQEALAMRRELLGDASVEVAESLNALAVVQRAIGKRPEAIANLEEAIEIFEQIPDAPLHYQVMNTLGHLYEGAGDIETSQRMKYTAHEGLKELLGENHPSTLGVLRTLAFSYDTLEQFDRAIALQEELIDRSALAFGPTHADTLRAISEVSTSYYWAGNFEQAERYAQRSWEGLRQVHGPDHMLTLKAQLGHCICLVYVGDNPRAAEVCEDLAERSASIDDGRYAIARAAISTHAQVLVRLDRAEEADERFRLATQRYLNEVGLFHPETFSVLSKHSELLGQLGRAADIEPHLQQFLEAAQAGEPANPIAILSGQQALASNLMFQERFEEAETLQRAALATAQELAPDSYRTAEIQAGLGRILSRRGQVDQGLAMLEQAYADLEARADQMQPHDRPILFERFDRILQEARNAAEPDAP